MELFFISYQSISWGLKRTFHATVSAQERLLITLKCKIFKEILCTHCYRYDTGV